MSPAPKTKPAPDVQNAALKKLVDSAQKGYPEPWIPAAKGEVIAGEFVRLETAMTAFGVAPLVIVKTEDGAERSVWLLHEALKSQFNRIRPETGDAIAVLYLGKEKAKNPTPGRADSYHNWRVTSDKSTPEKAWDILGASPLTASTDGEVLEDDIPY